MSDQSAERLEMRVFDYTTMAELEKAIADAVPHITGGKIVSVTLLPVNQPVDGGEALPGHLIVKTMASV